MARTKKESVQRSPDTPQDRDLFKAVVPAEPTAQEIFTLPYEAPLDLSEGHPRPKKAGAWLASSGPTRRSASEWLLVGGIVVVGAALIYGMVFGRKPSSSLAQDTDGPVSATVDSGLAKVTVTSPAPVSADSASAVEQVSQSLPAAQIPEPSDAEPASLGLAEAAYRTLHFDRAYALYRRLYQQLGSDADGAALKDFLVLRMGLCMKGLGQTDAMNQLLKSAAASDLPVLKALGRYHQAWIALGERQYGMAYGRFYQALALVGGMDVNDVWLRSFKEECRFQIGRALTIEALAMRDADKDWPAPLWSQTSLVDPFLNLDQGQVLAILRSGAEAFGRAVIGPRVELAGSGATSFWTVVCNGASIEECLTRFGAKAGMDINWSYDKTSGTETVPQAVRQRPVSLFVDSMMAQDVATITAGSVGLFVRFDQNHTVRLTDPANYRSSFEHAAILFAEALSHWQRLIVSTEDQGLVPNAHFAMAMLYQCSDQPAEAITEYRLVAHQFDKSPLAPHALVRSSSLLTGMKRHQEARDDLKFLVERYPDPDFTADACMSLAQATMKTGMLDDAIRLYVKVYNMELSLTSRAAASLAIGQCRYQQADYEDAARWIVRHLDLVVRTQDSSPDAGYLLLGKAHLAMGRTVVAVADLKRALQGNLMGSDYVEALTSLVNAQVELGDLVGALNALQMAHPEGLPVTALNDVVLRKAGVYRAMGLIDKALSLVQQRMAYLSRPQQRAQAYMEVAECYQAIGDTASARKYLSEVLSNAEPGSLADQAAVGLADLSLALGDVDKAIAKAGQVIRSNPAPEVRQRAVEILAQAYVRRGDLDLATKVLAEQGGRTRVDPNRPPVTSATWDVNRQGVK